MTSATRDEGFVRKLAESKFNYWAGYAANLTLIVWYISHAFAGSSLTLPLWQAGLVAVGAWMVWSFTEYFFHRWVYHEWESMLTQGHGLHHEHPEGLLGLPWYIPMPVLIGLYYLLAWAWAPAQAGIFMGVWWFGFVVYCFVHHSIHHFDFKNAWFVELKRHHKIHHKMEASNFGVTNVFWDRVLRTKHVKPSPAATQRA